MKFKGEFAVLPTDKICGRSLSSISPVDMTVTAYIWNYLSHDQRDLKIIYLRDLKFRSGFCRLDWGRIFFFDKTESFVGKNTSNHACQIFCSKSNCETIYHWCFLLEITVVKIMNNLNVCSAQSYLYPRSRFKSYYEVDLFCLYCTYVFFSFFENRRFANSLLSTAYIGRLTYKFTNKWDQMQPYCECAIIGDC